MDILTKNNTMSNLLKCVMYFSALTLGEREE